MENPIPRYLEDAIAAGRIAAQVVRGNYVRLRDVVSEYIATRKSITPVVDGRIQILQ